MTKDKRKTVKRWTLIAALLVATAIGGRWWANRTALRVLKDNFHGSLVIGDTESVVHVLRCYPELGRATYRIWQPNRFSAGKKLEISETPLHRAAILGDVVLTEAILATNPDVDATPSHNITPMHHALYYGHGGVAELLHKAGARKKANRGDLCRAVRYGHADLCRFLIGIGMDANAKTEYGGTLLLHDAVIYGHTDVVRVLLAGGADVNARYRAGGSSPLHFAGRIDIAKLLLRAGADANALDGCRSTPLHQIHNPSVVLMLIEAGADVNARDMLGVTPLHLVTNLKETVSIIRAGGDVNARDQQDLTPLHRARNAEIARALLDAGADPNAKAYDGGTPLHRTSSHEMAQVLLDKGANVEARDKGGATPLHRCRDVAVIAVLLKAGAKVNPLSSEGMTPLDIWTVRRTEFLASKGRFVHKPTYRYGWVGVRETVLCLELLRKHGAKTGDELKAEAKAGKE